MPFIFYRHGPNSVEIVPQRGECGSLIYQSIDFSAVPINKVEGKGWSYDFKTIF